MMMMKRNSDYNYTPVNMKKAENNFGSKTYLTTYWIFIMHLIPLSLVESKKEMHILLDFDKMWPSPSSSFISFFETMGLIGLNGDWYEIIGLC